MVNKGKKFGSTGHILSGQRQYTFFIFNHIYSLHGGAGYENQIERVPKTVCTLSKNTVKGNITFKTLNIDLG
jgi:hypothetical protein